MKVLASKIKVTNQRERVLPEKAILWPTQDGFGKLTNGDSDCFPGLTAILARKSTEQPRPLATFGEAVSQAQERVWVIDPYFLSPDQDDCPQQKRVDAILHWMPPQMCASDIRILTKSYNTAGNPFIDDELAKQFAEHAELLNLERHRGATQCVIGVRFNLLENFDHMHDRFAIIDDELWHFGATVGGFHARVNAATRGWRATDHGAIEFFNNAWNPSKIIGKKSK